MGEVIQIGFRPFRNEDTHVMFLDILARLNERVSIAGQPAVHYDSPNGMTESLPSRFLPNDIVDWMTAKKTWTVYWLWPGNEVNVGIDLILYGGNVQSGYFRRHTGGCVLLIEYEDLCNDTLGYLEAETTALKNILSDIVPSHNSSHPFDVLCDLFETAVGLKSNANTPKHIQSAAMSSGEWTHSGASFMVFHSHQEEFGIDFARIIASMRAGVDMGRLMECGSDFRQIANAKPYTNEGVDWNVGTESFQRSFHEMSQFEKQVDLEIVESQFQRIGSSVIEVAVRVAQRAPEYIRVMSKRDGIAIMARPHAMLWPIYKQAWLEINRNEGSI